MSISFIFQMNFLKKNVYGSILIKSDSVERRAKQKMINLPVPPIFFFSQLCSEVCGTLVPQPRIEPMPLAV